MKIEHFEILGKYEEELEKALHGNYCRFTVAQFDEVAGVYREMYGVAVTTAERNCNSCKMRILKQLARAYVEAKKEYTAAGNIAEEVNNVAEVFNDARESVEQAAEAAECMAEVAAKVETKRGRKPRKTE